jgi:hypothetical protein
MQQRSLKKTLGGVAEVVFFAAAALLSLYFWERWLFKDTIPAAQRLRDFARIPEQELPTPWRPFVGPARLRGQLWTRIGRRTPRGSPSAIWYAWVEDHYRSGRSTNTRLLCSWGGDSELLLSPITKGRGPMSQLAAQREPGVPLLLFHRGEDIKLLKHGWLERIPDGRIPLDLGSLTKIERAIPPPMREHCGDKLLKPRGTLHYVEVSVPLGAEVTVLACAGEDALVSCPEGRGALSSSRGGLAAIERAYANDAMSLSRGAALMVLISVLLLCSALLKHTTRDGEGG